MSLKAYFFDLKILDGLLVTRELGREYKEKVWREIERMEPNTVLKLDLSNIKFIDTSCADEVVVRVLARLEAGESPNRYMILSNMREQHKENIDTALKVAKKAVIVLNEGKWDLLGELVKSHQEALVYVIETGSITARELKEKMGYRTVHQASSRLGALYRKRLIAREPYRRPVPGGGRQFRYLSLL